METEIKIEVKNLYKIFGENPENALKLLDEGLNKEEILDKTGNTVGVQDASFEIRTGEVFVVMGLSGSGKSTIVRMLNRLIEPTSGEVLIDGVDLVQMKEEELVKTRRAKLGMVFQSFALMPHLTVLQNAYFGLELDGIDQKTREERAMQALEQVGLDAWAHSKPNELSGGMQQRVGLARGLAVDPDILLMDEAFSALDPLIRTEMQDELLKLQTKSQRTIVFISHDLDEAMRIGDRIAIMEGGRVGQVGTPEEILQNSADDYVRAFFRGVDPTNILSAGDIAQETQTTVIKHPGKGPRAALQRLIGSDRDFGYVLDDDGRFLGVVSTDTLRALVEKDGKTNDITDAFLEGVTAKGADDSMQHVLPEVASSVCPIPIIDADGKYLGVISKNLFLETLHRSEEIADSVEDSDAGVDKEAESAATEE